MVWDFFARLGKQRINAAKAAAKGKLMGAQAKAKGKAAQKFNNAIDGAKDKAVDKAKGAKGKAKKVKKDQAKDDKGMGLFGKKGGGGEPEMMAAEVDAPSFADKTQFIQVVEDKPKECVGWVVALNGALKGQDFRLVPGKNVLGTAADCDIVLTDQYLSGRHSVIRYEEGVFTIVDLDSTNGTYVNDERTTKEELIDNDRIRLARTELKFKSLY